MTRRVILTGNAEKELKALDRPVAHRIIEKLKSLVAGEALAVTRLRSFAPEGPAVYKLRVGDYRVLFRLEGDDVVVDVIAHRAEVYKLLRRR